MTRRPDRDRRRLLRRASRLADEIHAELARTRTTPPDALCAVFDALLLAAPHVADPDDPELFAMIERPLLHAGAMIERKAGAMPEDFAQ